MATTPIQQRLLDFRAQDRVHAGSLITTLFGDAVMPRGGRIWLGSLIRLLAPLGVNERLVRTAVFRLVKADWLAARASGRRTDYRLTESGRRRFEEAARQIYESDAPRWDRRWRLLLCVGEFAPKQREQLRRALYWQGFGTLADSFVHPGADLGAAFDALVADGLGELAARLKPLLAVDAGLGGAADDVALVARAWQLDELAAVYARFIARYAPVLAQLRAGDEAPDDATALQLRVLLIHDWRRLLLRDPELPGELLPADWPGQRARVLCKDIYRRLLSASERHLEQHFQLADGGAAPPASGLAERFRDADPLAP
ncbi:transcriptional repressor PaaX [mine drainage metagenome]|uniref:Transcriptional repressor PaaX n=1 Tax=mine drainage metagenome TaxID=410659 RepID=A0A1J5QEB4_9ZZZZ